jgi:RNA polymerase sigma-70 factor (ECF subfamily)
MAVLLGPHISAKETVPHRSPPVTMTRAELEAELLRHHTDSLGWALSCCDWDRAEAEDVLQTSYLRVLDGSASYAGRSSVRTWLFGVIRHAAAERRRARARRAYLPLRLGDAAEPPDPTPGADTAVSRAEDAARLVAALASLPARQREVLHLVFYEQVTIAEAAEVMRVSIGSARTHYERGKARLRVLLHPAEALP